MAKSRYPRCRAAPLHLDPRRARAQSEERRPRPAARSPGGDHRPVGLRQVLARLRHDLRRGPAPLCREPVGLCPPVPRADAEARRRFDRGPVAGDLDRAEDDVAQSALDGRHRHRDLRLPAPAVRPRRRALFARDRPADREPDRVADGRPHQDDGRRHAALPDGAHRARPQGRVPQGTAGAAEEGLPAGQDRRQALRDRRGALARQEVQARHRRRGRPHRRAARPRQPPGRFDRDGAQPRRGPRRSPRTPTTASARSSRRASPARSPASPSRRSSRGCSPSTRRRAPARPAMAWA